MGLEKVHKALSKAAYQINVAITLKQKMPPERLMKAAAYVRQAAETLEELARDAQGGDGGDV